MSPLFAGAAGYYEQGRLPYAPGLADAFARPLALDGQGRLLDVGCGPGTVTRQHPAYLATTSLIRRFGRPGPSRKGQIPITGTLQRTTAAISEQDDSRIGYWKLTVTFLSGGGGLSKGGA